MYTKRFVIEKKQTNNVEGINLLKEFKGYLGIENLNEVRVLNVYDIINATEDKANDIAEKLLFEEDLDYIYEGIPLLKDDEKSFRFEYHKGGFNQREDSTNEIINKFLGYEEVYVKHSKVIVLRNISDTELERIKSYHINSIEAKEVDLEHIDLDVEEDTMNEVEIVNGFIHMSEEEIKEAKANIGLGMDIEDILYTQSYFKSEDRDPSEAELKIIDTYWSDHCRHTTFMTEIIDIEVEDGKYKEVFEEAIKEYLASKLYVYEEKLRATSLMDLATINMKEIKKKGLLNDKEESDEVNAASIEIDVDVNGKNEKYLLMFKNETHNHPTEMEPFGGAATCLGGGIRDPLSGRAYVYQAMRITGAADPRQKFEDTLPGKLPQRKITQTAMEGYSSYGNQIGGTSGYIKEIYDEGFIAKRMELGALVAAVPKDWVLRGDSEPTDLIILLGGRTGRDGLGAAVGSSKEQTEESLETSGAEVQKGNPILERKIIRLFRNPKATKIIKKCNDFGAGGVAVAVGELADGLYIDLDKVPVKYKGMDGGEIALSESQERMAIVIDKENLDIFMNLAEAEDVEATVIAEVTDKMRLQMIWRDKLIVDIDRNFLDTNGIRKKSKVKVLMPDEDIYLLKNPSHIDHKDIATAFVDNIKDLNVASQKGLIERFDNTIGSGTVLAQLGGKHMLTPQEGMVAKIPVLEGETNTCSLMAYGYDPKLAKWSTFHGGYYAVIESVAKIVALGGDYRKIRLSFQEYYERLSNDPSKWGKPFSSLLGAFMVQKNLDIPSIGGKDSMSGSYGDINVPPSLFSFAVNYDKVENIISKEFKEKDSNVVVVNLNIDDNGLINFDQLKKNYITIKKLIDKKKVLSSATIGFGGMAKSIAEMCLGNKIGFKFNDDILNDIFKPLYGSIILEISKEEDICQLFEGIEYSLIGCTIDKDEIQIDNKSIVLDDLFKTWKTPLNDVFPMDVELAINEEVKGHMKSTISYSGSKVAPKVLIPIFTGTNGEYDLANSFKNSGAQVESFVFKSLSKEDVLESIKELSQKIKQSQILALANGAIYGQEPETGGKLLKLLLENLYIKEAIAELLYKNDGLMLGVNDGAMALIKAGLIENAGITYNSDGRFTSTFVDMKVVSKLSPWMNEMIIGEEYTAPIATKSGRIILKDDKAIQNGQVATQFTSINPTGSDLSIESLTSIDGKILGTISSIDRMGKDIYKNIEIKGNHKIFISGVKYFG